MADREKVIRAWKIFRDSNPYEICSGREFRAIREPEYCMGQMIEDTIAMLKEQEAVVPKYNARTNWYECGACHYSMTSGMHCRSELIPATKVRYCANCGFPVNWEGR
jgi:hypothetical protein